MADKRDPVSFTDKRFDFRLQLEEKGAEASLDDIAHKRVDIPKGTLGAAFSVGLAAMPGSGILLNIPLRKAFFEPHTKDMKPIGKPSDYELGTMEQTAFDQKGNLQLWISKPPGDSLRGYVVYFEGASGHMGDLGEPQLVRDFKKTYPDTECQDADPEWRDYRIKRIRALQEAGYGVIAVHLPGYGASKGKPSEKAYRNAVDTLIEWVEDNNIPTKNMTIMGASQGAFSATYMAEQLTDMKKPPALLTLVAPPLSTADCVADAFPPPNGLKTLILQNQNKVIKDPMEIVPMLSNLSEDTKVLVIGAGKDWVITRNHLEVIADYAANVQALDTSFEIDPKAEHATISPKFIRDRINACLRGDHYPHYSTGTNLPPFDSSVAVERVAPAAHVVKNGPNDR